MTRVLFLAAGFAIVGAELTAQAPQRTATSTFAFRRDARGCAAAFTTNARFLFIPESGESGTVLRETVSIAQCLTAEGRDAHLVTEAWPVGAPVTARPRFVIRTPGELGEVSADGPWYRVLQGGCCGVADLWRYFSLQTGRELFAASVPPIVVKVAGGAQRVLSVHDSYSAAESAETSRDSTVVAVIQYSDGDGPTRRVVARTTAGGFWAATALFFRDAKTAGDSTLRWLTHAHGEQRPIEVSDVTVVVILESREGGDGHPLRIEIPIVKDRLAIEHARASPGVRLAAAR